MALDIIILVLLLLAAILGYRKGFVGQIGQLIALLFAIVVTRMFGPSLANLFGTSTFDIAAAYSLLFVCAYLLTWLIARLLREVIRTVHLGIIDRIAGAVLKIFTWALILSIAFNVYLIVKDNPHALNHHSRPWRAAIVRLAPATLGFLSHEISH